MGTRFFKQGKYTPEKAEESLKEAWNIGFTEKPVASKIKNIPIEIYPVYVKGEIIGWNMCKVCTCLGYEKYLERRKERRPGVEIYNMNLVCPIHI